ncbi:MAG: peptide ABC transporter substrate-binding protein, partial [Verrucomicrobia bacterium]|nr:peptide ABC transporter substrate-binding protein [Verrucomicrobiota bacterium]
KEVASHPDLVENFFYSLTPIEVQGTLSHKFLNRLFTLCLEAAPLPLPKQDSYLFRTETEDQHTFAVLRIKDPAMKDTFLSALDVLLVDKFFISTAVTFQGCYILGYIHSASAEHTQEQFIAALEQAIAEGLAKIRGLRQLRLAFPNLPVSLDPRIGGDVYSAMILKMLFEGLMKYGNDGELTNGICKSVAISPDGKKYVFTLRATSWSNGTPVTAHDFAYAWKKILSPNFSTPYTYLFYPIKHAKEVKNGNVSPDQLGLQACDDHTLLVELEHPAPYFLELTALSIYSPVPRSLDETHPNWAHQIGQGYVCNGPCQLTKISRSQGVLELTKNHLHWDIDPLQPDRTVIMQAHDHSALEMFKNDEIDWLGSPLQAWNPDLLTDYRDQVESLVTSGIFWCQFNVTRFPFHNTKLRRAFAYAINRKKLIESFAYAGFPAYSPLPRMHTQNNEMMADDGNTEKACQLFHEALEELGISKKDFPELLFMHGIKNVFLTNVIKYVLGTWQELFGIDCKVEVYDWSTILSKIVKGDFQVGFICWEAWVDDPIYTLNSFKYGKEKINPTCWENSHFQELLNAADQMTDLKKRSVYLAKAESILIQEMPIIPILYEAQQFIKKSNVSVPVHINTGTFGFRSALITKNVPAHPPSSCSETAKDGQAPKNTRKLS